MDGNHYKVFINDSKIRHIRLDNVILNAYAYGAAKLNMRPRPVRNNVKSA